MERVLVWRLAVALGVGLLIGIERGWRTRGLAEGQRDLGVRTFGLAGLLGGVVGSLAVPAAPWLVGLGLIALALFLARTYATTSSATGDFGATTEFALLLAFALGALAAAGHASEAASAAIATTLLLGAKRPLHAFVQRIDERELIAALQLLLAAVVLLPLLPDRDFGPYGALNLRSIGLLALLIAALSFGGWVAVRVLGPRAGALLTALLGGLASSTAVTIAFARAARAEPRRARLLGAGVALAAATMALRLAFAVSVVAPSLLAELAAPIAALVATPVLAALALYARRAPAGEEPAALVLRNPLELRAALSFAALLAAVSLATRALHDWLGTPGLFALAGVSGLFDVDAVGLSLARMVPASLEPATAARAIVCAALANTLAKALLAALLGGAALARSASAILLATFVAGVLALALG